MISYKGYLRHLRKAGFKQIGSGAYSKVLAHPQVTDLVVKVVLNDPAYLEWAKVSLQHQGNPWFPRIHSMSVHRESKWDTYGVVVLEKLKPFNGGNGGVESNRVATLIEDLSWNNRAKVAEKYFKLDPDLLECVKVLSKLGRKYSGDYHGGNCMLRGGVQVVVTDPVAP